LHAHEKIAPCNFSLRVVCFGLFIVLEHETLQ